MSQPWFEPVGKGARVKSFVQDVKDDVSYIIRMVEHRAKYGSPPLLNPSEDVGLSPAQTIRAHQQRIQRRRSLLGIPYEEWNAGTSI